MHQGGGEAPPALPPFASSSLPRKQKDHRTNIDNAASTSPEIISPVPAVVPPPVFSPAAVTATNHHNRIKSDELRSSTCSDTPGWKDVFGKGCDFYEEHFDPGCPDAEDWTGEMGPATTHCCFCQGESESSTVPPINSPTFSNSPTKLASPLSSSYLKPSRSPSISSNTNTSQTCLDTPNWEGEENFVDSCDFYEPGCPDAIFFEGIMGSAAEHCCNCGGGIRTVSQNIL